MNLTLVEPISGTERLILVARPYLMLNVNRVAIESSFQDMKHTATINHHHVVTHLTLMTVSHVVKDCPCTEQRSCPVPLEFVAHLNRISIIATERIGVWLKVNMPQTFRAIDRYTVDSLMSPFVGKLISQYPSL